MTAFKFKIHSSQEESAFSPDEVEKLPAALKLEPKDVELILNTSTFIMQQVTHTHTHTHTLLHNHIHAGSLSFGQAGCPGTAAPEDWHGRGKGEF